MPSHASVAPGFARSSSSSQSPPTLECPSSTSHVRTAPLSRPHESPSSSGYHVIPSTGLGESGSPSQSLSIPSQVSSLPGNRLGSSSSQSPASRLTPSPSASVSAGLEVSPVSDGLEVSTPEAVSSIEEGFESEFCPGVPALGSFGSAPQATTKQSSAAVTIEDFGLMTWPPLLQSIPANRRWLETKKRQFTDRPSRTIARLHHRPRQTPDHPANSSGLQAVRTWLFAGSEPNCDGHTRCD